MAQFIEFKKLYVQPSQSLWKQLKVSHLSGNMELSSLYNVAKCLNFDSIEEIHCGSILVKNFHEIEEIFDFFLIFKRLSKLEFGAEPTMLNMTREEVLQRIRSFKLSPKSKYLFLRIYLLAGKLMITYNNHEY